MKSVSLEAGIFVAACRERSMISKIYFYLYEYKGLFFYIKGALIFGIAFADREYLRKSRRKAFECNFPLNLK
jgi:hypothetical protein